MTNIQKWILQLQSAYPNMRYEACEELRVASSITDEALNALREVIKDPDVGVADAAKRALENHQYSPSSTHDPDLGQESERNIHLSNGISSERDNVSNMYKGIHSWGIGLVIIGGISIVFSSVLDPVWGFILIIVGILSFKIKIPAMFIIFSVLLFSAAISNILGVLNGANIRLLGSAIIQFIIGLTTIRQFRKYRNLSLDELYENSDWPANLSPPQNEVQIANRFAIVSFILAVISVGIFSCLFIYIIFAPINSTTGELSFWVESGAINLASLAVGFGSAAILSKIVKRGWAIAGIILGCFLFVAEIGLNLLFIIAE